MEHLFVFGFVILLVWGMSAIAPVKDAIKRFK